MNRWGQWLLHRRAFLLAVWVGLCAAVSASAGVKAPCRAATDKTGSMEECSVAIPRLISELRDAVQKDVDKKYRGEDEGAYGVQGRQFLTPVCSLTANDLTGNQKETSASHLGQSCGLPAHTGYYKRGKRRVVFYARFGGGRGRWEGAVERGAWVQALACSMKETIKSLESQKTVESPAPASIVSDYEGFVEFASKTASPAEVAKCEFNQGSRDEVSQDNVVNCQASAMREQLQVAFKHIAMLGIYSRAEATYGGFLRKLYAVPSRSQLKDRYFKLIKDRCRGIRNSGEIAECYKRKYSELIESNVQSEIIAKGCG